MRSIEDGESPNLHLFLALLFIAVVVGGVIDLLLDAPRQWLSLHVLFEVLLIGISLGAAVYLGRGWFRALGSIDHYRAELAERQRERDTWRQNAQKLLEGLGQAIDVQFDRWSLTPAERETALLLLKGCSHKRIAKITKRSERTVRQHAVAVYRKAALSGRAQLSAFFLEDLLLPQTARSDQSHE